MYRFSFLILTLLGFNILNSQEVSGDDLLEKAIRYHDPNGRWSSFDGELKISMTTPKKPRRDSKIRIDLPNEYFYVKAKHDTIVTEYTLDKDDCHIALNGKSNLSKSELFSNDLSCERAQLYKNYYTYLYGLPMKLKDEGTIIHDMVEKKTFMGKTYLVLKVSYEKAVGSDIWYFYFNPESFAMEVYQFFKTDTNGKVKTDSGEYIILSGETIINDIKIPKVRAWYYNKDDGYLGTDTLNN